MKNLNNSGKRATGRLRVLSSGSSSRSPPQTLHDLGAKVIKVEPAAGDSARRVAWSKDDFGPMFAVTTAASGPWCSIFRHRKAAKPRADSLSTRRGAAERATRRYATSRTLRGHTSSPQPRLIVASVTGYGGDSPFSSRPGFDIAAQAESGMMSINGDANGPPMRVGFTLVDCHGRTGGDDRSSRRARTARNHGPGAPSTCR